MKRLKKSFFIVLFILWFAGCTHNIVRDTDSTDFIPYANVEQLDFYAKENADIIDYRISRKIALVELMQDAQVFDFRGSEKLSDLPVLILDETTGLPKYYEFQVLSNGEPCGFITANANIKNGEPIQFAGKGSHSYGKADNSRAANSLEIYDAGYPNMRTGKRLNRSALNSEMPEEKTGAELYEIYLENLSDEEIEATGYTREEMLEVYLSEQEEETKRLEKLWDTLLSDTEAILTCTDEEIEEAYKVNARSCYDSSQGEWKVRILKPWADKNFNFYEYKKDKGLYCGPAALGIVLGGFCSDHKTVDCSEYVESLISNGLKETGPVYYIGMTSALSASSDNKLGLKFHCGHSFDKIWEELEKFDAPVISLRMGNERNLGWHYRTIIGMARQRVAKENKLLWMKWTSYSNNDYYYLADNGSDYSFSYLSQPVKFESCNYERGGAKFWEKSGGNGNYIQHFAVYRH